MSLKKTLKPIKRRIKNSNTAFATIKRVYRHLSMYTDKEILKYYHVDNIEELEEHIESIKKTLLYDNQSKRDKLEDIDSCFCLDGKKEFKYLYKSRKDAQKQIEYTYRSKKIRLKLYPCPYHLGWHLSRY